MIDPNSPIYQEILAGEGLYLSTAAKLLPPCRAGRPTHASTLYRWAVRGVLLPNGTVVRLETTRITGRMLTTRGAIKRFLAAQATGEPQPTAPLRTPTKREREHAAAAAILLQSTATARTRRRCVRSEPLSR